MIKYIVGKNDRVTNYRLKFLKSCNEGKESWINPNYEGALEDAYHFDTAKEAKVVAKNLDAFVSVIEKKWTWKSVL